MSETRAALSRLGLNLRLAAALVLTGWVLRLVPKTELHTIMGIGAVYGGMIKDEERRGKTSGSRSSTDLHHHPKE